MQTSSIMPNFLGSLIGVFSEIKITSENISLVHRRKIDTVIWYSDFIDIPTIKDGFFGGKLTLTTVNNTYDLKYLKLASSHKSYQFIKGHAIEHLANTIQNAIEEFKTKAIDNYLRDSSIESLDNCLSPILSGYNRSVIAWNEAFDSVITQHLVTINNVIPISKGKELLRSHYEANKLKSRNHFYENIESNPLTEQQKLAVVRDNDRNLILAAAGTGKTSVMVAKALDIIDSRHATKDDILVLAYNRAAANELKERVLLRGSFVDITEDNCPTISTFHALGRKVLRDSNITTYLSEFSEDPKKLEMWVSQWLIDYISLSPESLKNFIDLSYQPINPFDFQSKDEYDAYVRDNEYRTFNGDRVRGYQELLISNWLFMNSVEYEYEAPYATKRRIEVGFDYKPDFHIKNRDTKDCDAKDCDTKDCEIKKRDIYIEHFGIDRSGNTRPDIDKLKYQLDMENKRQLHIECSTLLLETYHYDWTEGNLENRLEHLMNEAGVELRKKSHKEMFVVLKEIGFIDEGAKRYLKCLQAMRVERLDKKQTYERLTTNGIVDARTYTELLDSLHSDYTHELIVQDRIDFDDMILRSTNAIKSGLFKPHWSHILVDEFQDISMARMELLNALIDQGPSPILTVVGDDWQSIYRFSGGKLELTTQFEELVGSCSLTKLEKTFRYNNSIADTAGTFIMKNPEQYKKHVVTHTKVDRSQVHLLDSMVNNKNGLDDRIVEVVKSIKKKDPVGSIAILARYNYLLNNARAKIKSETSFRDLKYWTFHGSKGLEADYCILIGFFQGKDGFPNLNKEDAVVESLLPSLDLFPHSEERRLLYVAITRAKHKSYLIADPMGPSEFIVELLAPKYKLNVASKTFEKKHRETFKCHVCEDGHFRLILGEHGYFYSCNSGVVCRSKPRICDKCGAPSIDHEKMSICNNRDCRNEKTLCDRCGRPMKLRAGRFGEFWGCTGYGIKNDQCKHTRKYFG